MAKVINPCICCPKYIQASPCDEGYEGLPVYVLASIATALPGERKFILGLQCFTIDPSDDQVVRPAGLLSVTGFGSLYTTCSACEDAIGDGGTGSTGGGGGGGLPGNGPGGGGCTTGWLAEPCPDQDDFPENYPEVYANRYPPDELTGTKTFRIGRWCFTVEFPSDADELAEDTVPAGAYCFILTEQTTDFDDCEDCVGAFPCYPCTCNEFGAMPPVYVEIDGAPAEPGSFRHRGVCYTFSPGSGTSPIPEGATVLDSIELEHVDCQSCCGGKLAELCAIDESGTQQPLADEAPKIWIPNSLGIEEAKTFPIGGWCYHYDPEAEDTPKPAGAIVYYPALTEQFYSNCGECLCGTALLQMGRQIKACGGQGDANEAKDLWVHEDYAPEADMYFRDQDGICRWYDASASLSRIPSGAYLTIPRIEYDGCSGCVNDRIDEPNECPEGQRPDGQGGCIDVGDPCPPGSIDDGNGNCIPDPDPPPCPPGQVRVNGVCQDEDPETPTGCPPGYFWNGVICVRQNPVCPNPPCDPPPPFPPPPPPPSGLACRAVACEGDGEILVPRTFCISRSIVKIGGTCYRPQNTVEGTVGGTPSDAFYSCSQCQSSKCWFKWEQRYQCDNKTWSPVSQVDRACAEENPFGGTLGAWERTGQDESDCHYIYVAEGDGGCGEITDCTWPSAPASQTGTPSACCTPCTCPGPSNAACPDTLPAAFSVSFDLVMRTGGTCATVNNNCTDHFTITINRTSGCNYSGSGLGNKGLCTATVSMTLVNPGGGAACYWSINAAGALGNVANLRKYTECDPTGSWGGGDSGCGGLGPARNIVSNLSVS